MFNFLSGRKDGKPEFVSDEVLTKSMELIVKALELQINGAKNIAEGLPDGDEKLKEILDEGFFHGYLVGLCNRIAHEEFSGLIDDENKSKNYNRLIEGVVANLFYSETQPDWDAVHDWVVQADGYWALKNQKYHGGAKIGALFGEEIIKGASGGISLTMLGAELISP